MRHSVERVWGACGRTDRELVREAEGGGARGDGVDHARVDLDGGDARRGGGEEARGEVPRAGADL